MKIRYYGHVGQQSGYGVAAERMCMALLTAGHDLQIRPLLPWSQIQISSDSPLISYLCRDADLSSDVDATIVHTLPLDIRSVLKALSGTPHFVPVMHSRLVAYTTLDFTGPIPREMADVMDGDFDQIWFPCASNVKQAEDLLPAYRMPHAYDAFSERAHPPFAMPNDRFTFYYVGAWTPRKNPTALLTAFCRAFGPTDPVRLLLRSDVGMDELRAALDATGTPVKARPQIMLAPRITDTQMWALHRAADCFVTSTRAEAWNLPAFDAMLAGRAVISTHGVGSDDYLRDTDAWLIQSRDAPASDGTKSSSWALWKDPDILELTTAMAAIFARRRRTIEVHYNPADRYSYAAIGKYATNLLEKIKTP